MNSLLHFELLHFEINNFGTGKFFDINCNVDLVHVQFFCNKNVETDDIYHLYYRAKNK